MRQPEFTAVSDSALLVALGAKVDDAINRQIVELDRSIAEVGIVGVREIIPALVNLLVVFDPLITDHGTVQTAIEKLFPLISSDVGVGKRHVVKICYDEGFCPDLEQIALGNDMSVEAVIKAHSSAELRVSMYGFAPGFAYLTGVADSIQVPRKTAPVRDIPKGSVLIAGPQCLITTLKMPTGWSIIGRSDVDIMTDNPERPFLFAVGDMVSFKRVKSDELGWIAQ